MRFYYSLFVIALILSLNAYSAVLSEWRGPNRDGIYPNEKLIDSCRRTALKSYGRQTDLALDFHPRQLRITPYM